MADNTSKRGFGSMDKARQHQIASMGGKAAHAKGTAHEWTSAEATKAGQKGGRVSRGGRGRLRPGHTDPRKPAPVADVAHEEVSRFADEGNPHHD